MRFLLNINHKNFRVVDLVQNTINSVLVININDLNHFIREENPFYSPIFKEIVIKNFVLNLYNFDGLSQKMVITKV